MPNTSEETVNLNLGGNFADEASRQATAADKLGDSLDDLAKTTKKTSDLKIGVASGQDAVTKELQRQAQLEQQIATFDAARVRQTAALEARLKGMHDAALGKGAKEGPGAVDVKGLEGMGGSSILGGAVALSAGATLAMKAGEKILEAGVELAKDAAALTVAAGKLAIAETSKREVNEAVLGKLGGSYEQTVKMALKIGIDPDEALGQVKRLLNAKFSQSEIPALLKIKAGMDMEGLNGEEFTKKLSQTKLKGHVNEEAVKGFAEAGVDVNGIYSKLAKDLGVSVDVAKAKVKAGSVDMAKVIAAVEAQAADQFGGLADKAANTVPALAARIKGDFFQLFAFDPAILEPVKEALKIIAEALESDSGKALKEGLQDVAKVVADLFKDVKKEDVKAFLVAAGAAAKDLAQALKGASPELKEVAKAAGLIVIGSIEVTAIAIQVFAAAVDVAEAAVDAINAPLNLMLDIINRLGGAFDDTNPKAEQAGNDLAYGFADGITGGTSAAIDAAVNMASSALDAAKDALGIHSPSTEFAEVGHYSGEGMAKGFAANDNASDAAAAMASKALGAAAGVAGGGAGAGGALGGGGGNMINIYITGGANAEATANAVAAKLASMPQFRAQIRRLGREQREVA